MTQPINTHSPVYEALERAAIAAWCGGLPFTQRALAEAIAPDLGQRSDCVAQALPHFLDVLARQGVYAAQRARYGAKTSGPGQLTSPQAFNWSGVAPEDATLCTIVRPYLGDEAVAKHKKHALRSALRFLLELPTKCADEVLLTACARVSASELYALPGKVMAAALAAPQPLAMNTAQNHRTAIRSAMRYAAERRLVPLVFPQIWPDDAWELDKDRYFPLVPDGPTPQKVMTWRSAWTVFGATFGSLYPDLPGELSSVTRETAEKVIEHIQVVDGHFAQGYAARAALRYVAEHFGAGPFAGPTPVDAFIVKTPVGPRPALYLRGPNGEAGDGDWDAFYCILEHHRFPAELVAFLRWYHEYVTADSLDLITNKRRFPARRVRARLDQNTLMERLTALRAFLGAAVYDLRPAPDAAPLGLALDPSTLTPEQLFGFRFPEIMGAMVGWWRARAEVLPEGRAGKSTTGALRQMVIGIGMVALAFYEHLRHRRRLPIATATTASGIERVDWRTEGDAEKSPAEAAAWDAYRDASQMADALTGTEAGRSGRRRTKRTNDFKNIRRIVENTPPAYWIKLLRGLVQQMREAKAAKMDEGYQFHETVANAMLLGLLISTGCRIEELCHVRLDIQAIDLQRRRMIRLRAIDRKNGKAHDVLVQSEYVPDDLLEEYLDRTRPWFMAGRPAAPAEGSRRRAPARKRPVVKPHNWLLVSTSGRSFGCEGENADGTGRNKRAFKRRCAQAGQRFKTQMAQAARSLGMQLPGRRYEFGPHSVRGSCGYGVFLVHGIQKAAHYLGDEEETVRNAYSSINGLHVDSTCLVALDVRPQLDTAGPAKAMTVGARTSRLQRLVHALESRALDDEEFLREVTTVMRAVAAAGVSAVA